MLPVELCNKRPKEPHNKHMSTISQHFLCINQNKTNMVEDNKFLFPVKVTYDQ